MTDRLTPEKRSWNMAQIKSKNTKPELFLDKELTALGLVFEKHYPIPGKPDFAFPDKKVAVFVNGGFWHGKDFSKIKNHLSDFWVKKISGNIKRDRKNYRLLKEEGWKVVRIWDKNLKKNPKREINKILKALETKVNP